MDAQFYLQSIYIFPKFSKTQLSTTSSTGYTKASPALYNESESQARVVDFPAVHVSLHLKNRIR
jgi:hypothetical protein